MSGHLYVEGTISIGIGLPSVTGTASGRRLAAANTGNTLDVEGTGAVLMRFGGDPRTDPDFGLLLNVNAAPTLTLEGFTIDLSSLQNSATLYVDVPAQNKFTFAASLRAQMDIVQLTTAVIPGIPPAVVKALKKLIGTVTFTAQLDVWVSSTTNTWGVHIGVGVGMDQILGERQRPAGWWLVHYCVWAPRVRMTPVGNLRVAGALTFLTDVLPSSVEAGLLMAGPIDKDSHGLPIRVGSATP